MSISSVSAASEITIVSNDVISGPEIKYYDFNTSYIVDWIEFSVKVVEDGTKHDFFLMLIDENGNEWGVRLWKDGGVGMTTHSITPQGLAEPQNNYDTGIDFQDGNWHTIKFVLDNDNKEADIYVDGSLFVHVNFSTTTKFTKLKLAGHYYDSDTGWYADLYINYIKASVEGQFPVQFVIKDALSGQELSGVTVKENGVIIGTIDSGSSLMLWEGSHTLTFEKQGYWSVTKTVVSPANQTIVIEMYPSSAAFKLENFPSDITIPENTIYELTFTLSPIETSATYNTYLSLSGLSDIIEVRKDGSLVSPENGKYYLGDISSPVQVSIKFKAGAVGTHGFTLTLTSNDAIMSKTYTTTKTVTYTVEPLPFSVQMPSEWQVGQNELRISESSGQSYLITAVLKDSQGNEVWSDSYAFSPYEAHTFQVNVPAEGSYTLELMWNGMTAVYDITVNPAITLVTKTITVSEGGEGVITLHFKNPSSSVQYYTIVVSGGFLPAEINQSISVAPLTEKDVSIAFAVPEDLTYDAYELQVQVLQGDAVVFSDKVAVTIDSGGFTLFGGGSGGSTWLWIVGGLLVVGLGIWALRRR
nr:carboxypeptidase-like regulatory domain-containing protein [Thermococcus sp. LS1]